MRSMLFLLSWFWCRSPVVLLLPPRWPPLGPPGRCFVVLRVVVDGKLGWPGNGCWTLWPILASPGCCCCWGSCCCSCCCYCCCCCYYRSCSCSCSFSCVSLRCMLCWWRPPWWCCFTKTVRNKAGQGFPWRKQGISKRRSKEKKIGVSEVKPFSEQNYS